MTKFRAEKNIYSRFILQRLLDHWGVGKIEEATYFDFNAPNIWRHHLETNQGAFELFSYPYYQKDRSEKAILSFFRQLKNQPKIKPYYRFGRYHRLVRLTKKHPISAKQAMTDLKLLEGRKITKIFRVYGSILQIILDDDSDVLSYANWNVQKDIKNQSRVLVDSAVSKKTELDNVLENLEPQHLAVKNITLDDKWFEIYLANNLSLHFHQSWGFPAVEAHISGRKNEVMVYDEKKIYYVKSEVSILYI